MSDLSSIDTPEALQAWFATEPSKEQKQHAFNQLVESKGFDRACRLWKVALGCTLAGRSGK